MPGSAARTKAGLQLICPQRLLRTQAKAQQHWQRDQSPSAGNRIDKARDQTGAKQNREVPGFEHERMVE